MTSGASRAPCILGTRAGGRKRRGRGKHGFSGKRHAVPWQPTAGHMGTDIPRRIDAFRACQQTVPAVVGYEVVDSTTTRSLSDHLPIKITIDRAALA